MKKEMITRRYRWLALAGVAAVAIPLAVGQFAPASNAAQTGAVATPISVEPSMARSYRGIVEATKPAVVTIMTKKKAPAQLSSMKRPDPKDGQFGDFFRRFFDERGMPMPNFDRPNGPRGPRNSGLGSGFIVTSDGTIVTNNHVVAGAEDIKVVLDDGTEYEATLVGGDSKTDLAVIRIEADEKLPTVAWGNSDNIKAGDPIVAIGNPFGLGSTVTAGIVSARGRDLRNGPYDDFIQVDAPINHGNSGGPLIDMEGRVVGVNTAIYSPNGGNVGVGFAIPSEQAQDIVSRLIENGSIEHGFIGVRIQPVTEDVAEAIGMDEAKGALIASVSKDSPASEAGIEPGDVVMAFGMDEIDDPKELSRVVADLAPGTESTVEVFRKGKAVDLSITVGTNDEEMAANERGPRDERVKPGSYEVGDLGITLSDLDKRERKRADLPKETEGAVIASVDGESDAAETLRRGDIILSVNQEPVSGAKSAGKMIEDAKQEGKNSVLLLVERDSTQSFVAVPFARG